MRQQTAPRPRAGPAGPSKLHLPSSTRWGLQGVGELQINRQPPAMGGPTRLCARACSGGFPAHLAGAQRPRGRAVPPAPSSRARLAPPPAPPGRAVLGPLPGTSSAGAGLPPLTRPQAARRESEAPITGAALCWGSGPGSSCPPPPNLREGLGSPGGGERREQEQPRAPERPSPNSKVAWGGSLRSPRGLKQRDPLSHLAADFSGFSPERPWRPWTTGHPRLQTEPPRAGEESWGRRQAPRRGPGPTSDPSVVSSEPHQAPLLLARRRQTGRSFLGNKLPPSPALTPTMPPTSCLVFLN